MPDSFLILNGTLDELYAILIRLYEKHKQEVAQQPGEAAIQAAKDINRSKFAGAQPITDFVEKFKSDIPFFRQGQLDGSTLTDKLRLLLVTPNIFEGETPGETNPKIKTLQNPTGALQTPNATETNAVKNPFLSFELVYLSDDRPPVPCGLSLLYHKDNPNFWVAVNVKNTNTADPESTMAVNEGFIDQNIIDQKGLKVISQEKAKNDFLAGIKSEGIKQGIAGLFDENGAINPEAIKTLKKRLHVSQIPVLGQKDPFANFAQMRNNIDDRNTRMARFEQLMDFIGKNVNNTAVDQYLTEAKQNLGFFEEKTYSPFVKNLIQENLKIIPDEITQQKLQLFKKIIELEISCNTPELRENDEKIRGITTFIHEQLEPLLTSPGPMPEFAQWPVETLSEFAQGKYQLYTDYQRYLRELKLDPDISPINSQSIIEFEEDDLQSIVIALKSAKQLLSGYSSNAYENWMDNKGSLPLPYLTKLELAILSNNSSQVLFAGKPNEIAKLIDNQTLTDGLLPLDKTTSDRPTSMKETYQYDFDRLLYVGDPLSTRATYANQFSVEPNGNQEYVQGILDAEIFILPLISSLYGDQDDTPETIEKAEKREKNQKTRREYKLIKFAYMDKQTPCGFALAVHPDTPSDWSMAIIKNTNSYTFEGMDVILATEKKLVKAPESELSLSVKDVLLKKLPSHIQPLITKLFDGEQVNLQALENLDKRLFVGVNGNIDNREIRKKWLDKIIEMAPKNTENAALVKKLLTRSNTEQDFFEKESFKQTLNTFIERISKDASPDLQHKLQLQLYSIYLKLENTDKTDIEEPNPLIDNILNPLIKTHVASFSDEQKELWHFTKHIQGFDHLTAAAPSLLKIQEKYKAFDEKFQTFSNKIEKSRTPSNQSRLESKLFSFSTEIFHAKSKISEKITQALEKQDYKTISTSLAELNELNTTLEKAQKISTAPKNDEEKKQYLTDMQDLAKQGDKLTKTSTLKKVGMACLILAGVALVVAGILAAIPSGGASLLGVIVGIKLATTATAAVGISAGLASGGAGLRGLFKKSNATMATTKLMKEALKEAKEGENTSPDNTPSPRQN